MTVRVLTLEELIEQKFYRIGFESIRCKTCGVEISDKQGAVSGHLRGKKHREAVANVPK